MNAYLVVPETTTLTEVFDRELVGHIRRDGRAVRNGVLVIMPKDVTPAQIMSAASAWSEALFRQAYVTRIALVLGITAYSNAEPILPGCVQEAAAQRVQLTFFHEGHLETDAVRAWSDRRAARSRRVSTDALVKLAERYVDRGDVQGAIHAYRIAEENAKLDEETSEARGAA